jgi:hypothetical protein
MKIERTFKNDILRTLRKMGMLCKKPHNPKPKLKILRTVYPDVEVSSMDAERHVWVETKKVGRKSCNFDSTTMDCSCGVNTVEEFAQGCKK